MPEPTMTVYVDGKPEQRPFTLVKTPRMHSQVAIMGYDTQMEPDLLDDEQAIHALGGEVYIVKVGHL